MEAAEVLDRPGLRERDLHLLRRARLDRDVHVHRGDREIVRHGPLVLDLQRDGLPSGALQDRRVEVVAAAVVVGFDLER